MPEVSCRATAGPIEVLEKWGRDPTPLGHGLPHGLDYYRRTEHRLDWESFAQFMHNLGTLCTTAELEAIGVDLLETTAWPAKVIVRRLISPFRMAQLAVVFSSPIFPTVTSALERRGRGSFAMTLEIPPDRRGAIQFFHITKGHWRSLMSLAGHPETIVETEIDDHRGHYVFRFDARRALLGDLPELFGAVLATPAWLRELQEERREIRKTLEVGHRWWRDFHGVLDELRSAVVIHRDGRILYANPALLRAIGRTRAGLLGTTLSDLIPADQLALALEALDQGRIQAPTLTITSSEGVPLCFELRQRQDVEFHGEAAVLLVAHDVTEQRRMHERLLHADRMSSLGMLAANIAHEVNNPLAYLLNSLQIMQREIGRIAVGEPIEAAQRRKLEDMLEVALEGGERMSAILGSLNSFTRTESTSMGLVDVRRVLESALEIAAPEIGGDVCVVRDLAPVPAIVASELRLNRLFLNVILNASQSLREKTAGDKTLWLRCATDAGGHVVAEIEDDGIGIPAENMPKIFDPFFTTKPAGVATGLGLAICRDIVTRLDGTIDVSSREGAGARVRIAFPPPLPRTADI